MYMRGTSDQCEGHVHLRGARTRATDMCKINRRIRTCEARIVANFLVWTSKLLKLGPKTSQDSHQSATERPKRSTWSPKRCQGGSKGRSKCAQGTPRTPKERPRGSQRATKIAENRSWRPSGHPKKNKKRKCNKPMRKSLLTSQKCNKHMRKLHVRK